MKQGLILPILAATLLTGACEEDSEPINVNTQASVRLVNAVSGVSGNLAFTANGRLVGSPTSFGQATAQCTRLNAGPAALAFGTANSAGTGIQGNALTTTTQGLTAGGNFALVAAGTQASPRFFVLNNSFTGGSLGSNQAAVRFINLVPSSGTGSSNFDVFTGTGTTATTRGLGFGGTPTSFNTMTAGTTTFNFRNAGGTSNLDLGGTNTVNLQGGTVNTIAILPTASGTGFRVMNITGC